MSIKKIRNFRFIARELSEEFGNKPSFYLKPMIRKARITIKTQGIKS